MANMRKRFNKLKSEFEKNFPEQFLLSVYHSGNCYSFLFRVELHGSETTIQKRAMIDFFKKYKPNCMSMENTYTLNGITIYMSG